MEIWLKFTVVQLQLRHPDKGNHSERITDTKDSNMCKWVACYTISWIACPFWFVLAYNLLEDRHIDDITFNNISFSIREKQIDFVLLWVSTVMY